MTKIKSESIKKNINRVAMNNLIIFVNSFLLIQTHEILFSYAPCEQIPQVCTFYIIFQ